MSFFHIWNFFFVSVEQPNKEADELLVQLMLMKHLFLDVFEKVKFFSETELGALHLASYECWFALIILCKKVSRVGSTSRLLQLLAGICIYVTGGFLLSCAKTTFIH